MATVGWDPFWDVADLRRRLDPALGNGRVRPDGTGDSWVPRVNISGGNGGEFTITAELPDVKREDIEVTLASRTLTLRGEKKMDPDIRSDRVQRLERSYGSFSRAFTLPETVDSARVRAEFKDGVLTLKIPLREDTRPRQITVEVSD